MHLYTRRTGRRDLVYFAALLDVLCSVIRRCTSVVIPVYKDMSEHSTMYTKYTYFKRPANFFQRSVIRLPSLSNDSVFIESGALGSATSTLPDLNKSIACFK